MDALYQGALFLSCGDAGTAEDLVVDTVMLAFQEHAAESDPERTRRWFEARLVRAFLRRSERSVQSAPVAAVERTKLDPDAFEGLGSDDLFEAASILPPGPRAALWLVLLRRWGHHDAARVLGVDDAKLQRLLEYRDLLMKRLLTDSHLRKRARGIS